MSEVRSQAASQLLSRTQAHSPGPDSSLKLRWEHQQIRFSEKEVNAPVRMTVTGYQSLRLLPYTTEKQHICFHIKLGF